LPVIHRSYIHDANFLFESGKVDAPNSLLLNFRLYPGEVNHVSTGLGARAATTAQLVQMAMGFTSTLLLHAAAQLRLAAISPIAQKPNAADRSKEAPCERDCGFSAQLRRC
jgi:hypothetical protein